MSRRFSSVAVCALLVVAGACKSRSPSQPKEKAQAKPAGDDAGQPAAARCRGVIQLEVAYPGAQPETVEQEVIQPIEEALGEIDSLEAIRSVAAEGRAEITARVEGPWRDTTARVRKAIGALRSLPKGAGAPAVQTEPARSGWSLLVAPASEGEEPGPFRRRVAALGGQLVKAAPGRRLRKIGPPAPQLRVTADPARLRAFGLDTTQLAAALRRHNASLGAAGAGVRISDDSDLTNVVVKTPSGGAAVRLGDVAKIEIGTAELPIVRSGERPAALFVVEGGSPPGTQDGLVAIGPLAIDRCTTSGRPAVDGPALIARVSAAPGTGASDLGALGRRIAGLLGGDAGGEPLVIAGASLWRSEDAETSVEVVLPFADKAAAAAAAPRVRQALESVPDVKAELLGPGQRRVTVVLAGPSLETLASAASELEKTLGERAEVTAVSDDRGAKKPQLDVKVSPHAAQLGVTAADVAAAVRAASGSLDAGRVRRGRGTLPVLVSVAGAGESGGSSARVEGLRHVMISTSSGASVPLSAVASFEASMEPAWIHRRDGHRSVTVTVVVAGGADEEGLRGALASEILPGLREGHPHLTALLP